MRILIHGYYGAGNAGDDAILQAMVDRFHRVVPGARITVVVRSQTIPAYQGPHEIQTVLGSNLDGVYQAVRTADVVVIGGGGLFQDYHGYSPELLFQGARGSINYYIAPLIMARQLGKRAIIYGVGIGPFQESPAAHATAAFTALAHGISVRDAQSVTLLRRLQGPEPLLSADPAVNLQAAAPPATLTRALTAGKGPRIGINLRHWPFAPDQAKALHNAVRDFARAMVRRHRARIIVFPFNKSRREIALAEQLVQSVGKKQAYLVTYNQRPDVLKGLFKSIDVMVAMRLHASILALGARVPTVGLVYDPKVRNLYVEAGIHELLVPIERLQPAALLSTVEGVLAQCESWIKRIDQGMAHLEQREQNNLVLLARQLQAIG